MVHHFPGIIDGEALHPPLPYLPHADSILRRNIHLPQVEPTNRSWRTPLSCSVKQPGQRKWPQYWIRCSYGSRSPTELLFLQGGPHVE